MSEDNDYDRFRQKVPVFGDRLDRIENVFGAGLPDTNYCFGGFEGWVEYKAPIEPKRATTRLFGSNHPVSQDQKNWFNRQIRSGGRCFFLISTDKRWMLIGGRYADELNDLTVDQIIERSDWVTMKPVRNREHWASLREALMR